MDRSRNGRTAVTPKPAEWSPNGAEPTQRARQRAFCIAALPEGDDLAELGELLRTAGVAVVGEMVQRREQPHPNTYLGPGKVAEAKAAALASDANVIACDDELSARQERNLEEALGLPGVDRTTVILDIFAAHAHTAEGKLQVELAQLEYNLARMRGLWSHLERLGGGVGNRGPRGSLPGRGAAHLPQAALAGYTNAGKSTLLNALTGSDVPVRDRLFHTLDPTTRVLRAEGRDYLLTDTVGFIRKLPHQLVDAFGATLEETIRADLILHVVDATADEEELDAMIRAGDDVLHQIEAAQAP